MHEDVQIYIEEIELILKEIDRYETFKNQFLHDLKNLNKQYEKEIINYKTYTGLKEKFLQGKTKEEHLEYYNSYILSLVRKIEYINTQVFSLIYNDNASRKIILSKSVKTSAQEKTIQPMMPGSKTAKAGSSASRPQEVEEMIDITQEKTLTKTASAQKPAGQQRYSEAIDVSENAQVLPSQKKIIAAAKNILQERRNEINEDGVEEIRYEYGKTPRPLPRKSNAIPKPRKKGLRQLLKSENSISLKQDKEVGFTGILNFGFLKDFIGRMRDNEAIISKDTVREKSLLDFHGLAEVDFEKESRTNPNLLVKQADQLKELLKKRKIKIYSPSMIGTLANILVRRFTIFLIEQFPDFFKEFYLTLRYANIKILSNTYVNIMVLLSFISAAIFGAITAVLGIVQNNPLQLLLSKIFLMAMLGAGIIAGMMIYYPHMQIKKRLKSINTNMSFAIDHMSSIVASGVPPSTMFRLLSESKEYGEVSLEIEKASNFIDVFGYDLLTALKSVSATTPSPQLKEFFDGLISTIETGGSLKNYLSQKSQESMLSYKIERQKYVETISTYSDIYTGVLIAAPLFFVSALSLVSILGGKIGGFEVETVIAFGTYAVIPLMNIIFIIFLELNQPDI